MKKAKIMKINKGHSGLLATDAELREKADRLKGPDWEQPKRKKNPWKRPHEAE